MLSSLAITTLAFAATTLVSADVIPTGPTPGDVFRVSSKGVGQCAGQRQRRTERRVRKLLTSPSLVVMVMRAGGWELCDSVHSRHYWRESREEKWTRGARSLTFFDRRGRTQRSIYAPVAT